MRLGRLKAIAPDITALVAQAVFIFAAYFMFNHLWGTRKAFYEENKTMLNAVAQRVYFVQRSIPDEAWEVWEADTSYLVSSPRTDRYFSCNAKREELDFIEKNVLSIRIYRNRCVEIIFGSRSRFASARLFALKRVFPKGSKEFSNRFCKLAHSEAIDSGWYYEEYSISAE